MGGAIGRRRLLHGAAVATAAWALRGDVQRAEGSRTEALVSYHRALCYQPQFPEVQLALADVHSQDGKPQRALATIQALAYRAADHIQGAARRGEI